VLDFEGTRYLGKKVGGYKFDTAIRLGQLRHLLEIYYIKYLQYEVTYDIVLLNISKLAFTAFSSFVTWTKKIQPLITCAFRTGANQIGD
jgi:hypothetical protein